MRSRNDRLRTPFSIFPERTEGELTRIKSVVVSRTTCAKLSIDLHLGDFLQLGKVFPILTRFPCRSRQRCLNRSSRVVPRWRNGIARAFLTRLIEPELIGPSNRRTAGIAKSLLQQLVQKNQRNSLYRLLDECGRITRNASKSPPWSESTRSACMGPEQERGGTRRKTPGVCFRASHLRLLTDSR